MSHYQSKGDWTEAQLRKAGRSGSGSSRGSTVPQRGGSLGGGTGGPNPSATAPQVSGPAPASHVTASSASAHAPRPSTPTTPADKVSRKANEPAELSRDTSEETSDHSSSTQQPGVLQKIQSSQQAQKQQLSARLPSSKPGVKQNQSLMEVPRSAVQPAFTFQFGSISPGFMHNTGLQIPPRTSSAPPNLDEQKREMAQFEAARASAGSKAQTAVFSGPQQARGPPHLPPHLPTASSLSPQVRAQVHLQPSVQLVEAQSHPQQPRLHQPVPHHQGSKFSQPMNPPQHTGQVLTPHATHPIPGQFNHQLPPQMGHHLGPQSSGPVGVQLPPGLPGPQYGPPMSSQYIPPRTNRAVKIVNPNTHEELRFDSKVKKNDSSVDKGLPSSSSPVQLSARLSNNSLAQPRIGVPFVGAPHHQMNVNFFHGVQVGPYGPSGPPFYRSGLPSSAGAGIPSNPPLRYGFTPPQSMPYVNHSVASGPTIPPVAVMGMGPAGPEHVVPDTNIPIASNLPVQSPFVGVPQLGTKGLSASLAGRPGPHQPNVRAPGTAASQAGHDLKEKSRAEIGALVHMERSDSEGGKPEAAVDSLTKITVSVPSIEGANQEQKVPAQVPVNNTGGKQSVEDVGIPANSKSSNVSVENLTEDQVQTKSNKGLKNSTEVASLDSSLVEVYTRSSNIKDSSEISSRTAANENVSLPKEKDEPMYSNTNVATDAESITEVAIVEVEKCPLELIDGGHIPSTVMQCMQIDAVKEVIESSSLQDKVSETSAFGDFAVCLPTLDNHLTSVCKDDNGQESFQTGGMDKHHIPGPETIQEIEQADSHVKASIDTDVTLCPAPVHVTEASVAVHSVSSLVSESLSRFENNSDGRALDINAQTKAIFFDVACGTAELDKVGNLIPVEHLENSTVEGTSSNIHSDQAVSSFGNSLERLDSTSDSAEESYGLDKTFQNLQEAKKIGIDLDLQLPSRSTTVLVDVLSFPKNSDAEESSNIDPVVNTHFESRSDKANDCIRNGAVAVDVDVSFSNSSHENDQTCAPAATGASQGSKKKKKKVVFAKADAAGISNDLYNAFKTSKEKKREEIIQVSQISIDMLANQANKDFSLEKKTKKELDNWEDVPENKGRTDAVKRAFTSDLSRTASTIDYPGNRKYTRDFLLTFQELCFDFPAHFEARTDFSELFLNPDAVQFGVAGDLGRNIDRQPSNTTRLERRSSGPDEDRWIRQPGIVPSPSLGYTEVHMDMGMMGPVGGFRPGQNLNAGLIARPGFRPGMPMPSPLMMGLIPGSPLINQMMGTNTASIRTNGVDADRWQRAPISQKGIIPSPYTPMPAIHKSENRYEVGKVSDEEDSKQRQIKSILNKLTPQNFDKLFEKVKEVHIESANSLTGVISQIFDKALLEPTFCEMYAKFCVQLSKELPEFNEDGEKVTFKRVLLNKCQEEFERGEREQEEAMKFTPEESEDKRVKARRRMLGNIRFIGELYKKSMLTERIMHECIKKLLGGYENPDEEDVEALCKLMATIGLIIDHVKAKQHIDAYFTRMSELAINEKLSSRLRFLLKDVLDLRRNGWQERRKVEGPKKIDEVHRDAAHERQVQSGRDRFRGLSMGGMNRRVAPPAEFGMRGPPSPLYSSPQPMGNVPLGGSMRSLQPQTGLRNTFGQDVRTEDRLFMENRPMPMTLSQRPADERPIILVPQGGLGRGLGTRAQPSASGRSALADLSPAIHGDPRRSGIGPLSGYSAGIPSDRGPFTGRVDHLSLRSNMSNAERVDRPLLDRPLLDRLGDRFNYNTSGRDLHSFERLTIDKSITNSALPYSSAPITSVQAAGSASLPRPLNEEQLREKSELIITEYFSARDMKEAAQCVDELKSPKFHSTMVCDWVSKSLERKDNDREYLAKLLIHLSHAEPPLLSNEAIIHGFELVLCSLEDTKLDVPKAPEYVADMLGKLMVQGILSLPQLYNVLRDGGLEPGSLTEGGDSLEILGTVLETLRREKGEAAMVDAYKSSGIDLEDFMPSRGNTGENLDAFLRNWSLQCLCPMARFEKQMREALERNQEFLEMFMWFEKNVPQPMFTDGSFLRMVMTQVLRHCIPSLPVDRDMNILKGRTRNYATLLRMFSTGKAKVVEASHRQYIVAVQLFVNNLGHPPGLMTVLFDNFYHEEVISERAYTKWQDDVKDSTPGRDKAIREVGKWLAWLATAPEEAADED